MNGSRVVRLPDGMVLCWCTELHDSEQAAAACDHRAARPIPYVPGAPRVMSGKTYVSRYGPAGRRRWMRVALRVALLVLALVVVLEVAMVANRGLGYAEPRGPVVTPSTYGPPGPVRQVSQLGTAAPTVVGR